MNKIVLAAIIFAMSAVASADDVFRNENLVAAAPLSAKTQIFLLKDRADEIPSCVKGRYAARNLASGASSIGCWWDMGDTVEILWIDSTTLAEEHQVLPRTRLVWR